MERYDCLKGFKNNIVMLRSKFLAFLLLLMPCIVQASGSVTNLQDLDAVVDKTKALFLEFYGYTVLFAIIGAILAIAVIKFKGIIKAALEENYIRDLDSENKKVRVVIMAVVVAIVIYPVVFSIARRYGYTG